MSDLNTLIQFFAAIYLTITIDNLVFKRFWTPDLYSVVDAKLNEFNFALSSHLNNTLMKQIKNFASSIDRKARRRGGYILLLCISTMIFIAFESSFVSSKEYYFAFNITLLCALVGYFIGIFIWEKWLSVFFTYFILLLIFVVNIICCKYYLYEVSDSLFSSLLFGKCLLIVFLVIPLIIRLFLNWLNSTIYIDYLVNELGMEKARYNKTIGSIQSGNSTGCDPAYNSAFKEAYFNKENLTDQLNTNMSELLVERIIDICSKREFWFLCVYFFKNLHKKNKQIIESPYTEKYSLPIIAQTDETYSNLLKEYEAVKTSKKLRDFCAENKVDYEDFRRYRLTKLNKV